MLIHFKAERGTSTLVSDDALWLVVVADSHSHEKKQAGLIMEATSTVGIPTTG
jgi:hypothetical protein